MLNINQIVGGLRISQKIGAYHEGIICTHYEAMFGCLMKIYFSTSAILRNMIGNIKSEEHSEK